MDIIATLAGERSYNLHSHTEFCDGRAQMRAFAKEAVESGMRHYGFSPHSPIPIESPCNMAMSKVPEYLEEVERLSELYSDRDIRFYASMEIDYLGEEWGPAHEYFRSLPLDYRIGSVHFIPNQDGTPVDIDGSFERFQRNMESSFHRDIRYVVDTFFDQSLKMVEAGGFDIIGHFDKIAQNGSLYVEGLEDAPWYRDRIDQLIDAISRSGVIVEINTKAFRDRGRFFPARRYFSEIARKRIPVVVNSDAHVPALINASRDEAFSILDSLRQ